MGRTSFVIVCKLLCGGLLLPLTLTGCGGSSDSSSSTFAPTNDPIAPVATAPAIISQSDSGFARSDYSLSLLPSGAATYNLFSITPPPAAANLVPGPTQTGTVPAALTAQFFKDLTAALPLQNLPASSGGGSIASTTVILQYQGQKGYIDDLSDPREAALEADVVAIAKTLGLPQS